MSRGRKKKTAAHLEQDARSAMLFAAWLRRHGLSIDAFRELTRAQGTTPHQVGRSTISALAGSGGTEPQSGWSGVRRPTLLRLHSAVSLTEPMTLRELGQLLLVDMTGRRAVVWADVGARAGQVSAPIFSKVAVTVTWDLSDPRGPHVCLTLDGRYVVVDDVPPGWVRQGRLRVITPNQCPS